MITMTFRRSTVDVLLAWAALAAYVASTSAQSRPNVLLIVSEDNGPELGCYGDESARTPHLDRLAAGSVRFDLAFTTQSVCSPSRASILTGLYPHQNGQLGLATHAFELYRSFATLPALLGAAGYRTGIFGKLHVNPASAFPFDVKWRGANAMTFGKRDVAEVARRAATFFEETDGPFFLMVNYPDAHFPLLRRQHGLPEEPQTAEDVRALPFIGVDGERLRKDTADYYNCLSRLDSGVGMLLDVLEQSGRADETIVVYLGDHGAQFSRGKVTCYESGLRIPLLVRWPGVTKAGHVERRMVSVVDLMPTFLTACGVDAPPGLPGRDLRPLCAGEEADWREHLFAERNCDTAFFHYPQRSVRDERFKLILTLLPEREDPIVDAYANRLNVHFAAGTTAEEIAGATDVVRAAYAAWKQPPAVQMFDLAADPHELVDIADHEEFAADRDRLIAALADWRERTRDPLADPARLRKLTDECDARAERSERRARWDYPKYLPIPDGENGRR